MILRQAVAAPNKVAVSGRETTNGCTRRCSYTYLQLCEHAWQLGAALDSRYGVRRKGSGAPSRVGLTMPPSPLYVITTLALALRGLHPCIIQASPATLRRYQLEHAPCLAVLTVVAKKREADSAAHDGKEQPGTSRRRSGSQDNTSNTKESPVVLVDELFDELFRAGAWGYPEGPLRVIGNVGHLQSLLRGGS